MSFLGEYLTRMFVRGRKAYIIKVIEREVVIGCGQKGEYGYMRIQRRASDVCIYPLKIEAVRNYTFKQVFLTVKRWRPLPGPACVCYFHCQIDGKTFYLTQGKDKISVDLEKGEKVETNADQISLKDPRFFFKRTFPINHHDNFESTINPGYFLAVDKSRENIIMEKKHHTFRSKFKDIENLSFQVFPSKESSSLIEIEHNTETVNDKVRLIPNECECNGTRSMNL